MSGAPASVTVPAVPPKMPTPDCHPVLTTLAGPPVQLVLPAFQVAVPPWPPGPAPVVSVPSQNCSA